MFNPEKYLTDLRGQKYLEVKFRVAWFRDAHPDGQVLTTIENLDPLIIKATVIVDGTIRATGHGSADAGERKVVWSGREIEKAETAAIGRALAHAGFGTQFTGEDESDNLADSPVERKPTPKAAGNGKPPAHPKRRAVEAWIIKEALADNDFGARGVYDALNKTGSLDELLDNGEGEKVRDIIRLYRAWRNAGAETPVAAGHALAGNDPAPAAN